MTVFDNVKELKGWIAGAIAFDATITSLLVAVFRVDAVKTTIATTATTIVALAIIFLIYKSEARSRQELQDHIDESNAFIKEMEARFDNVDETLLEIRRSSLRIELGNEIRNHPENHDTIMKMAEKYFGKKDKGGLEGNWVMEDAFQNWIDAEKKANRPVNIPKEW